MKLNIDKPIVFLDIEATGLDRENDRIIELCMMKMYPNDTYEKLLFLLNPLISIPPLSTKIHGFTDEDVADKPTFAEKADKILHFIRECDIGGFNSNAFDIPMLYAEFERCGKKWAYSQSRFFDVGNIFKRQEPRTLEAAVKFYCDREHDGAHGAHADVIATIEVFKSQMERYDDIPANLDDLHFYCNYDRPILDLSGKFTMDASGTILLNFGKYRGCPAADHIDFLQWMMRANFSQDTLDIAMGIIRENWDPNPF